MKTIYIALTFLFLVNTLYVNAQNFTFPKQHLSEENKIDDEYLLLLDTSVLLVDTMVLNIYNPYPMTIIEVPDNTMAQMPNMSIRDDIHYHMRFKKYHNYHAPKPQKFEHKFLPDNDTLSDKKTPEK